MSIGVAGVLRVGLLFAGWSVTGPLAAQSYDEREEALQLGLVWLAEHQREDGSWEGAEEIYDVGMTGLALLAFLGDGNTPASGDYEQNVARGLAYLKGQQNSETGLFGQAVGHGYMYNHAIASFAVCEAQYLSPSPLIKRNAQKAIDCIVRAQNPDAAWRYSQSPNGENDTSVTGWMVLALSTARKAKLEVEPKALAGALAWIDEVTDTSTGHVGYDEKGSESSRVPKTNEHYPREDGEAMTAIGLLCRIFLGQSPNEHEVLEKHAKLLRRKLPEWDADGLGNDMYYWLYGTYAMFQMGEARFWGRWEKAMRSAVVRSQRKDGEFAGSWDPVGPWGYAGGRVYSTACMVLCLEAYYRYARVFGDE